MIGSLFIPEDDADITIAIKGWRIAFFRPAGDGFIVTEGAHVSLLTPSSSAILETIDGAAILCRSSNVLQANELLSAYGSQLPIRSVDGALCVEDYAWLNEIAADRFKSVQQDLCRSQVEVGVLREALDDLRLNFNLLEAHLGRRDAPLLRRIWTVPWTLEPFVLVNDWVAVLPVQSLGLTRLSLWIERPPAQRGENLHVSLQSVDADETIEQWSLSAAEAESTPGWITFDLKRSLKDFALTLRLRLGGADWVLGAGPPWLLLDNANGSIDTKPGPALRVYATLPDIEGPKAAIGAYGRVNHRMLLGDELLEGRPLRPTPEHFEFEPVSPASEHGGLLIHPMEEPRVTIAVFDHACPAHTKRIRLVIRHANLDGQPFLVAGTIGTDASALEAEPSPAPTLRIAEPNVLQEVTSDLGAWVRLDGGATASIVLPLPSPTSVVETLMVATKSVEGLGSDQAWAVLQSIEFLLDDE